MVQNALELLNLYLGRTVTSRNNSKAYNGKTKPLVTLVNFATGCNMSYMKFSGKEHCRLVAKGLSLRIGTACHASCKSLLLFYCLDTTEIVMTIEMTEKNNQ